MGLVLYLSGPMTGVPGENYEVFNRAATWLRSKGFTVINPAETGPEDTAHLEQPSWHDYMASAIKRMEGAAGLIQLPGWEDSFGARIEAIVAEKQGIEVCSITKEMLYEG